MITMFASNAFAVAIAVIAVAAVQASPIRRATTDTYVKLKDKPCYADESASLGVMNNMDSSNHCKEHCGGDCGAFE